MELTQVRGRSIKLAADDEPTDVHTNTRSAPYEQEPEEPSSTAEVSVVLDEPPTTLRVTRVAKPNKPDPSSEKV